MKKKKIETREISRGVFFPNYDYTSEGPNKTSPGGSPFHGVPGGGEKSLGTWIKKRRKKMKRLHGLSGL